MADEQGGVAEEQEEKKGQEIDWEDPFDLGKPKRRARPQRQTMILCDQHDHGKSHIRLERAEGEVEGRYTLSIGSWQIRVGANMEGVSCEPTYVPVTGWDGYPSPCPECAQYGVDSEQPEVDAEYQDAARGAAPGPIPSGHYHSDAARSGGEEENMMDAPDPPKHWPKTKQTKQQLLEQHRAAQAARAAAAARGGIMIVIQSWGNGACALFVPRGRNSQMARPADWFGAMDEVKATVVGSGWVRVRWRGGWAFPAEWQVPPAMLDAAISGALTKRGYQVVVEHERGVGEPPEVQELR